MEKKMRQDKYRLAYDQIKDRYSEIGDRETHIVKDLMEIKDIL